MSRRGKQYGRTRRVSDRALAFDPCLVARLTEESEQMFAVDTTQLPTPLIRALRFVWRSELSDIQRDYFLLYYRDGMNMRQIAARRGVTESTVSRTLTRARRNLRHYLQFYYRLPER